MTLKFTGLFSEIQILSQHTDIVRHMIRIDSRRCCSAGDDGLAIVWDVQTGSLLHILRGHSRPITCIYPIPYSINESVRSFLLTASSDRLVCMWDVETGSLLRKFTEQNSTTKCIVSLSQSVGLFCLAGEKLCLWSVEDGLLDMISADTSNDIQFLLALKDDTLIAAADTQIVFYKCSLADNPRLRLLKSVEFHRESVRSLVKLSDSSFASGSLDGAVLMWSASDQAVVRQFNVIDDYQGLSRTYPFSVQYMLPLSERLLLCAHGCGLTIYDTESSTPILIQNDLHVGKLLHLELLYQGRLLATSSEDSNIRLWQCSTSTSASNEKHFDEHSNSFLKCLEHFINAGEVGRTLSLELVGECQAHSAAVQMCLDVPPHRFLSCGVDHTVILWKNRVVESCRRHRMVRDALFRLDLLENPPLED